jgi:Alr-MurF fusion protein
MQGVLQFSSKPNKFGRQLRHVNFSLKNIAKKINASVAGDESLVFSFLSVDSRSISDSTQTLFVALQTSRNNGHNYIADVYQKGVRTFLVSEKKFPFKKYPGAGFLIVENTLEALQQLAAYKRSLFKNPVLAITGSNGKTVVKEWLYQLMQEDEIICRSPKSFNSQIGVPLSVWQLEKKHALGIFEAGISHPGEMERLAKIISPTEGLITNVKAAHEENFSSRKEKANEKLKLFLQCKKIFYCADQKESAEVLGGPAYKSITKSAWSSSKKKGKNIALNITKIEKENSLTHLHAKYKGKILRIKIPFTDDGSIENAIHCWLYLLEHGYVNAVIAERIQSLAPVAMRLELKQAVNNSSLVNDSYSSDLESLSIALDFLNRQHQHPKKTVILSDIIQSGKNKKELYKEVTALLHSKKVDRVIGIGSEINLVGNSFKGEKEFYSTTEDFISTYNASHFSNEAILLKGARKFEFERIGALLQQKSHDTILEINLNSVIHNLNYYRGLIKPGTRIMAMVKAFSYGSGSYEIASALQHHNVNYLAVAYTDEGVDLRKGGIKLPIMVMNPEPQSFNDLLQYHLEPEIFSARIFDLYADFVREKSAKEVPGIHIKLDTGMHRLGFEETEIPALITKIKSQRLKINSIFSHLAASDEPSLKEFTQMQLESFIRASEQLMRVLKYKPLRHISNSAAIRRFPEAQFDMVRLGIGMYGVGADAEEQKHLQNSGTWKTIVSQIKKLQAGETVGYSRRGVVNKPTVIATVPVGYADGFSRKLVNGKGGMYVSGRFAPVIGNVCMDMCMLDITGINAAEGDEVIIFNSPETLSRLAQMADAIPYEVLTAISPRVKRIYLEE